MATLMALVWALAAFLVAAAAQSVLPSNATLQDPSFMLIAGPKMQEKVADLNALSTSASSLPTHGITGALFLTTTDTASNISSGHIAFITCDLDQYPGHLQAMDVINTVVSKNITTILLYTVEATTCNITDDSSLGSSMVYTLTDKNASQAIKTQLQTDPPSFVYLVNILHQDSASQSNASASGNGDGDDDDDDNNPLGPSPSTAVAMIILYSITGVITALFLVIIITGAIRAHRHPDRYGPRDVMGRPRQSRAKGLARAMLDSIPIVKFGENEPPKPEDVELGSQNSELRERQEHQATAVEGESSSAVADYGGASTAAAGASTAGVLRESLSEGIAPAEFSTAAQKEGIATNHALGCSICTDDFQIGQDIRVLPCDHRFHPACVDPWLLNVSGTCPLCRIDLRPTTSHGSDNDHPSDEVAPRLSASFSPPLEDPEHSVDQQNASQNSGRDPVRRRSRLVSIFAPDRLNNSTAEERLAALRRLRERSDHTGRSTPNPETNVAGEGAAAEGSAEDVRRTRRLTLRLHDVFGIRTRRQGDSTEPETAG